jgi:hypothetical protein
MLLLYYIMPCYFVLIIRTPIRIYSYKNGIIIDGVLAVYQLVFSVFSLFYNTKNIFSTLREENWMKKTWIKAIDILITWFCNYTTYMCTPQAYIMTMYQYYKIKLLKRKEEKHGLCLSLPNSKANSFPVIHVF